MSPGFLAVARYVTENKNGVGNLGNYTSQLQVTCDTNGGDAREDIVPLCILSEYGSLIEAYTFMKGETDVIQNYNNTYLQYMERLKDLGEARENTDANRVGLPARPRT